MLIRPSLCIPTYNNENTIADVIKGCLEDTDLPILIVDDGSRIPVKDVLEENEILPLNESRINIVRLKENNGKGLALQTAIKELVLKNFTHMICLDGDGQHLSKDISKFLPEIKKNPWALIIGKRKFEDNVPGVSKFGRNFSNFWVKYQTDLSISDSQSGFRSYPLFFLQNTKFFTKRYDFEIEVLIRLLWTGVPIEEIEINVYYPKPEERVSHFDKLWDNVRISILNTILVVISLIRSHLSKKEVALSIGVGVFVGVLPIFGIQAFILGLVAFLFRLNFPLMLLASQISIPPFIPLITFLSLSIGAFITGQELFVPFEEMNITIAKSMIVSWWLGSIILGILFSSASMIGITIFYPSGEMKNWNGKSRGGTFGNFFIKVVTKYFGRKVSYFFLFFITPYFYFFSPRGTYASLQYLKIVKPELSLFQRHFSVVKHYFRFGQVLIDGLYKGESFLKEFKINRDGDKNLVSALEQNRGVILAGAHVGGWNMASASICEDSDNTTVNIVEFNAGIGNSAQNKIYNDGNINFINDSLEVPAIFAVDGALKKNEIVVMMSDRALAKNVEIVHFFGKLIVIDSSAFRIAYSKNIPISFSYNFKGDENNYNYFISKPILYPKEVGSSKEQSLYGIAQQFANELEIKIKKYPYQWFNFYPFFSALPNYFSLKQKREEVLRPQRLQQDLA